MKAPARIKPLKGRSKIQNEKIRMDIPVYSMTKSLKKLSEKKQLGKNPKGRNQLKKVKKILKPEKIK